PADRFHRKRDRRIRRAAGSKLASKPSGLNAFPRAFKSCKASQAGLLASRRRMFRRRLITVARPRGNFTRFPILPTPVGHLDAFEYKELSDLGGHYHAIFRVSNKRITRKRGGSPTVREGVSIAQSKPSLTVGLPPHIHALVLASLPRMLVFIALQPTKESLKQYDQNNRMDGR